VPTTAISAVKRASFNVHDRDHVLHRKLWSVELRSAWERWFSVHEALESRYQAPQIINTVELPDTGIAGLLFEHVDGVPPASGSRMAELVDFANRLHGNQELATKLSLLEGATTGGQYFERMNVPRWNADISMIRDTVPSAIVDEHLLNWMVDEMKTL
jgi:hypothetical protein